MATDTNTPQEGVSALVDGQLRPGDLPALLARMEHDPHASERWELYHRLGDLMRGEELLDHDAVPTVDLSARVMAQLRTQHAPLRQRADDRQKSAVAGMRVGATAVAANGRWRWRWVAAVAVVGVSAAWTWWMAVGADGGVSAQLAANLDEAEPPGVVQVDANGMVRDPRLDALMAAHRQFGGASALQKPAGFLRNATHEPGGGEWTK